MSNTLVFNPFFSNSIIKESRKPPKIISCSGPSLRILCSSSAPDQFVATEISRNNASLTGSAYDFDRATTSLSQKLLSSPKKVTIVRHGLSTWNKEGRVQGSSDLSVLTEAGIAQAERCRAALIETHFDKCFSSPISRAKSTAEILWQGREEPLVFLDSLKEAHLYHLEGMKNGPSRLASFVQSTSIVYFPVACEILVTYIINVNTKVMVFMMNFSTKNLMHL
ncbi:hypothetical protein ACS0TY_032100 [Phlomoides rotata]